MMMFRSTVSRSSLSAVLCGILLALVSNGAWADIGDVAWAFGGDFQYRIVHLPDIDQFRSDNPNGPRAGLPNDGKLYCVPTSCTNLLAYLSAHGFPNSFPGVSDWQSS